MFARTLFIVAALMATVLASPVPLSGTELAREAKANVVLGARHGYRDLDAAGLAREAKANVVLGAREPI
ncbi:hypothetical protein EIP91_004445, partial [Steccherinum ochraceum]